MYFVGKTRSNPGDLFKIKIGIERSDVAGKIRDITWGLFKIRHAT